MKKNFRLLLVASIAFSVCFVSCKKIDRDKDNAELATHADDQSRVSSETDAVANDAGTASENFSAFSGRPGAANSSTTNIICDASTTLDSTATDRIITITYNGTNCYGTRTRTGVVTLSMPLGVHWRDMGAVLTVNAQNLKITRLRDNKSITINGTATITNVSGGRLLDLAGLSQITHEIASSGVSVTFDDGTTRTWQIAKRRVFTYDNGIVITTTGIHTDGNTTNISEWGTTRFGTPFVTSITQPMIIRQDCYFRLVSGQVTHERLAATVLATFGLDSNGNSTSCPALGEAYYFKIVWTGTNGTVRTVIWPY